MVVTITIYEGEWKKNKSHGQGTFTYAGCGWSSGEWYKGVEQTPAAVKKMLLRHHLSAFLQAILDIGVYAPLDILPICINAYLEDLTLIGMQTLDMKQFKQLCDELKLRQMHPIRKVITRLRLIGI